MCDTSLWRELDAFLPDMSDGACMLVCPICGEWYWSEDGCSCCVQEEPSNLVFEPLPEHRFVTCSRHPDVTYFWEDSCPLCDLEDEEVEDYY